VITTFPRGFTTPIILHERRCPWERFTHERTMLPTVHDDSTQTSSGPVLTCHCLHSLENPCGSKWGVAVSHFSRCAKMTICNHMKSDGITQQLTTCPGLLMTCEHQLTDCSSLKSTPLPEKEQAVDITVYYPLLLLIIPATCILTPLLRRQYPRARTETQLSVGSQGSIALSRVKRNVTWCRWRVTTDT
jgi:hypothetical protein